MSTVKSFSVGNGDMFYIKHNSSNFSMIDCRLNGDNSKSIIRELKKQSADCQILRFLSTHPDEDHFGGIHLLDDEMPICNFYVVKNNVTKDIITESFKRYRHLRDGEKAFFVDKGCKRKWLNQSDDKNKQAGIEVLWPNVGSNSFQEALLAAESGDGANNISMVIQYSIQNGARYLWLGDLETDFMEKIEDEIDLTKTTVVFAAHHGRDSGHIPHSWLKRLDPQIIVIGEAPSRHLNYYTGYHTLTQNTAGDITMENTGNKIHIYTSNDYARPDWMDYEFGHGDGYVGTIVVETEYTLENMNE